MADVSRPDRLDEFVIADRRKKVAALYLNRQTQAAIAQQLGCDRTTVGDDLKAMRTEWNEEHRADIDSIITREAAELDSIEGQAAQQFAQTKEVEWLALRLKTKERRARLLGLDQPSKTDWTSGGQRIGEEWTGLRTTILTVLEAFPEARLALAEALEVDDGS